MPKSTSMRILVAMLLFTTLAADSSLARCTSRRCPDAAAIAAIRAEAAATCECTVAPDHKRYLRCAKDVLRRARRDDRLSEACRRAALRCEAVGSCGRAVDGFAENDGVRIHHVSMGEGPLVVMIHGFPDFWYTWRDQMAALADDFQVVAIDTRGYNLSDQPVGVASYGAALLLGDVEAVIRSFGRERAVVVGHDWGGFIAWFFAMTRPEMTERLIVLNLPHPNGFTRELATNPQQQANSEYARVFQEDGIHEILSAEGLAQWVTDERARARYVEAFRRSDFEAMLHYYRANYPREPYVQIVLPFVIRAPVLLIHGLDDPFLLAPALNDTWDWLSEDLTLVTVPRAGHFVHQDASDLVTRTMHAWLLR
jgi:pimeloyl-ACP methyl ester carboxylesterase